MNKRETGQVLPLGLVLVALGMVGAFMLFNTGQVASDKMRLANSADAAAYSGALWQARALNYQAYANRAMVANHVAVAQAVSLHSWMAYATVTAENISTVLSFIPFVNVVASAIERGVAFAEQPVSIAAKAMLRASDIAITALSQSQNLMQVATYINTPELIEVVASETDARFSTNSVYGITNTLENANQWRTFSKKYNKRDKAAVKEREKIVLASRDGFSRKRNWNLFDHWLPTGGLSIMKVRRQGETRLQSKSSSAGTDWEWMAKDTLSMHTRSLGWFRVNKLELPIGWASSFANSKGSDSPIKNQKCKGCKHFTKHNHTAESAADYGIRSLRGRKTLQSLSGYGGVRPFWVLSDKTRKAEDAKLRVRVEVSLPAKKLVQSNELNSAQTLSAPLVLAGNTLSSISVADVLYRRPDHRRLKKDKREKSNAYNPYWSVQLANVSLVQRELALGLRSGGSKPATHQ